MSEEAKAELAELRAEVAALKAKMEVVLLMLTTDKPETVKHVDRITDVVSLQF
jgi:hypothetical protein